MSSKAQARIDKGASVSTNATDLILQLWLWEEATITWKMERWHTFRATSACLLQTFLGNFLKCLLWLDSRLCIARIAIKGNVPHSHATYQMLHFPHSLLLKHPGAAHCLPNMIQIPHRVIILCDILPQAECFNFVPILPWGRHTESQVFFLFLPSSVLSWCSWC